MKKFIQIPRKVCSDYNGYGFFIDFIQRYSKSVLVDIELDFNTNEWFEANLCAVLGACINEIQDSINQVSLVNIQPNQEAIFSRNHFLSHFGGQQINDNNNTTIKFRKYKLSEEKLIKEYLDTELLNKTDFPRMSDQLRKKIGESIFEIFSNADIHGHCSHVFSCGQYYPNKTPPRIDFTIVDMGRTIKTNVSEYLSKEVTGEFAVNWAMQKGHTTKTGNIPGGLGLKLILEFLQRNNGKMQIVSADGYWEINKGRISTAQYHHEFPGTIVNIEFNLNDNSSYFLKSELTVNDIF